MPTTSQEMTNIYETAKSIGDSKMFVRLVEAADLEDILKSRGLYTVFAPTDEAFRNLPTGTIEGWLQDLPKLRSFLKYHIVEGKFNSSEIHRMTMNGRTPSITTLQESPITLKTNLTPQRWVDSKQTVYVNDAKVVRPEIETSNGVIHTIDRVLEPTLATPAPETPSPSTTTTTTTTTTPEIDLLRVLPDEIAFYFYKALGEPLGVKANSLIEFSSKVKEVDKTSIRFHTERRDFENWIRLFGDPALVRQIANLSNQTLAPEELQSELSRIVEARLKQ